MLADGVAISVPVVKTVVVVVAGSHCHRPVESSQAYRQLSRGLKDTSRYSYYHRMEIQGLILLEVRTRTKGVRGVEGI